MCYNDVHGRRGPTKTAEMRPDQYRHISACGNHLASDAWMFQLNFVSQMKTVSVPFPPRNLDPPVMWNLSQLKYLPVDAVKESKEPGDDERQLSAGYSVCSILMGSPDTHKSIMEEAPEQLSARWTRPACMAKCVSGKQHHKIFSASNASPKLKWTYFFLCGFIWDIWASTLRKTLQGTELYWFLGLV